jgi:broad specificity phosphatase PhoE
MTTPSSLQRKPFWAPVGLAAVSAVVAALVMSLLVWFLVTAKSTTVIVIRDAQARAELLAHMFGDVRLEDPLDAIYVSPAARATALPLAGKLGLTPVVVAPQAARSWARRMLREHRGGRILVVAPADVARDLAAELSGVSGIPPMDFGTMYIVTIPRIGRANLLSVDY